MLSPSSSHSTARVSAPRSGPVWRTAPGVGGMNTIFAAHVNYVNYRNGPFAYLHQAAVGDALYVTLDSGAQLAFTAAEACRDRDPDPA